MAGAAPVEARALTKRYGSTTAVADLSFTAPRGRITGFLGPNGAGKSTTLRMLLGLVHPTSGEALVEGTRYVSLSDPVRAVGAVLESDSFHPGRSGRNHLRVLATVKREQLSRENKTLSAEEETQIRQPILDKYELEGSPYYSTARLWDDGILDPAQTRNTLALALSVSFNAPIPPPKFGVFRM